MNSTLYRRLWYARQWIGNKNFLDIINRVDEKQYLDPEQIELLQLASLKSLLKYAYDNSDFYNKKYSSVGLVPEDISSLSMITKIPVVTKEELRLNLQSVVPTNIQKQRLKKMFTGGSTGKPLTVYHDRKFDEILSGLNYRTLNWWGLGGIAAGLKIAHVWGLNDKNKHLHFERSNKIKLYFSNYVYFNAFEMSNKKLGEWREYLVHYKPELMIGYTSALYEFSVFLNEIGEDRLRPKAIWSTSEPLFDFQKKVINNAFDCNIYSQYGINEVHHLAADCKKQIGMHINADYRLIEVVDDGFKEIKHGVMGNILVTDFINYAMPLIRYDTGDMSVLKQELCSCGSKLPLLDYVNGRVYDVFVLKDGTKIYGHIFTTFFYKYISKIKSFQVHQTNIDKAVVNIVPADSGNMRELLIDLKQSFESYTKHQMKFEISVVDAIQKENSGKQRFVKSDVRF